MPGSFRDELPSALAVSMLPVTCRNVVTLKKRAYVTDKSGQRYMTIDYKDRYVTHPTIDVSVQFFRDHFSRCSCLVRSGVSFELSFRGSTSTVFARRHTGYSDPLDRALIAWRGKVEEHVWEEGRDEIVRQIGELRRANYDSHDVLLTAIRETNRGLARIAIGHKPFVDGLPALARPSDLDRDSPAKPV